MTSPVIFSTLHTASGHLFGMATLNNPAALNALTLPMIELLDAQLVQWAGQDNIAGVIIAAEGDKAFCAGGDVVSLHHAAKKAAQSGAKAGEAPPEAAEFFEKEYRLDYRIHTYPKPVLCWAHGIVMGGGVGLMMGASHRVVSPNARVAMPEIHIGLFPDVAGSWFLQRVPHNAGLFLGLTGAIINSGDALHCKFADVVIEHSKFPEVLDEIRNSHWAGIGQNDRKTLSTLLAPFSTETPAPLLLQHQQEISEVVSHGSAAAVHAALLKLLGHPDTWLNRAASSYVHGSPTSAALFQHLYQRLKNASLAEVFRIEYQAAVGCCAHHDFPEGVRALLVDKDKNPKWSVKDVEEVAESTLAEILRPRFKGAHPLDDLH
ncbi:MAG TPA: enoyl-CoA hydratase/isomerase family protein [Limnobacter sp.]|nr:enoyl-CoA hydratase/isomerase family protein [Limnobacter sp.]